MVIYTHEEQRYIAQQLFPQEWAATLTVSGPKRRRRQALLRKRGVYEIKIAPLRLAGASCTTCRFRTRGWYCDVNSDFWGNAIIRADYLCTAWEARAEVDAARVLDRRYEMGFGTIALARAVEIAKERFDGHVLLGLLWVHANGFSINVKSDRAAWNDRWARSRAEELRT